MGGIADVEDALKAAGHDEAAVKQIMDGIAADVKADIEVSITSSAMADGFVKNLASLVGGNTVEDMISGMNRAGARRAATAAGKQVADAAEKAGASGAVSTAAKDCVTDESKNVIDQVAAETKTPEGEASFRQKMKDKWDEGAEKFKNGPGLLKVGVGTLGVGAFVLYFVITGKSPEDMLKDLILNPLEDLFKRIIGALGAVAQEFTKEVGKGLGEGAKVGIIIASVVLGIALFVGIGYAIWKSEQKKKQGG